MNEILNYHLLLSHKVENASYAWIQKYKEQCNELQEIRCNSATLRICLDVPTRVYLEGGGRGGNVSPWSGWCVTLGTLAVIMSSANVVPSATAQHYTGHCPHCHHHSPHYPDTRHTPPHQRLQASSPALKHCLFLHVSVLFCCVVRLSLKMRERPPCNVLCIVYYSILDVECIISLLLIMLLLRMPMFPTNFVFCNVPVLIGTDTTFTAATNNFVFPRYFMASFYYFTFFL